MLTPGPCAPLGAARSHAAGLYRVAPADHRFACLVAALLLLILWPTAAAAQSGPVTMNETAKLLAPDGGSPYRAFGSVVAIAGDAMVVAANHHGGETGSGAAYVFLNEDGAWMPRATLLPSDGAPSAFFGSAVAISGDVIVVGVPSTDHTVADSGSAYVFVRPPGGWSGTLYESAKLRSSNPGYFDRFGQFLAVSGDTVVVSAYWSDASGPSSGCAYVFVKPAGGWSGVLFEDARLLPSTGQSYDHFGSAVAVSGPTVAIGAYWVEEAGPFTGAAYVFERPEAGWAGTVFERAKLIASDRRSYAYFGQSIAIDGGTVFVGANDSAYSSDPGTGAAYAFERPVAGWSGTLVENARLLASDGSGGDSFGVSLSAADGLVVVGASEDDDRGDRTGAAYVFERPGAAWAGTSSEAVKLLASDGASGNGLGFPVALANRTVVAGVPQDADYSGAIYVFALPSRLDYPFASFVTATPDPAVVTEPVTVTARVSGRYPIAWAEYEVRDAAGAVIVHGTGDSASCPSSSLPCPEDGTFNGTVEYITVTIPPGTLPAGSLVVCVRAGDTRGQEGYPACDALTTTLFAYDFRAFFQLAPAVNQVAATSTAIPLRFTLHGDYGMDVFAPGFPRMAEASCESWQRSGEPVALTGLFTYRPETDRYQFSVRIDPAWRGTCRLVEIGLDDGTVRTAYFAFAR